jgi:aryl-alcohol dehydrogenase-like predicted oxidoreductase
MKYRSLGRTGVQVSSLCLGCMMFGGKTPEAESMDIIDCALDTGVNFLDTANVYSRGCSEEAVGKALRRNGKRSRIVLATKVQARMTDDDPNAMGVSRRHIIEQCEASLRRLQADYIDLYQVHHPMSSIPIDETLRALDDLVHEGKVRYIGSSDYAAWQVMEALWASGELGLNRFVCTQPPYNMLDRRVERELAPMCQTYGISIIPWAPLAGGFLSGKYRRGETCPEGARHAARSANASDPLFSPASFDVLDVVTAIANEKGCTPGQFALAWCAEQAGITSPIIGPRTMEQVVDNLGCVQVQVTAEDRARVDKVSPPGREVVPYYQPDACHTDFGPHRYRW